MSQNHPLVIENLSKSFGIKEILHNINLTIPEREIFGLIGLNGEGKTTLIKLILDLISSKNGNISIFGQENLKAAARRSLAYLPEKFHPSSHLKGEEFLQIYLASRGQRYDPQAAKEMVEALALDPAMLLVSTSKYSKGMGQKLGLAAIFLSRAPLLILDEPMSGLDPQARSCLKSLMREYVSLGNSIFFTSHILADIEEIATQIAILHQGKLLYQGYPEQFKQEDNLEEAFLAAIN